MTACREADYGLLGICFWGEELEGVAEEIGERRMGGEGGFGRAEN